MHESLSPGMFMHGHLKTSALVVMVRAPEPGKVKTRLSPPLTEDEAAGLYKALVKDTFRNILTLQNVDVHAACTQAVARAGLDDIVPDGIAVTWQEGKDLGEKLLNVFKSFFLNGYSKVVVIGSDSPDLPSERITKAFSILDKNPASVVLGPAVDGGYYLIAMDALRPEPFKDIPWGTPVVLKATLKSLAAAGIEAKLLDEWYDIDTPRDLQRLCPNPNAPSSEAFLRELGIMERIKGK